MPRPALLPFPIPRLGSPRLRRRLRRLRRSRLAWWLCAVAIGLTAATSFSAAEADLARARATCTSPEPAATTVPSGTEPAAGSQTYPNPPRVRFGGGGQRIA